MKSSEAAAPNRQVPALRKKIPLSPITSLIEGKHCNGAKNYCYKRDLPSGPQWSQLPSLLAQMSLQNSSFSERNIILNYKLKI